MLEKRSVPVDEVQDVRLYLPGYFPEGQKPYVTLGVGQPKPRQRKWPLRTTCNVLHALLFGYEPPKQTRYRR